MPKPTLSYTVTTIDLAGATDVTPRAINDRGVVA